MKITQRILTALSCIALSFSLAACGGGSGGDDNDGGNQRGDSTVTIEGTLRNSNGTSRILGAGDGGRADVTVSALGDSATTDELGNFTLVADGAAFAGGAVAFGFSGTGLAGEAVLEGVTGGPGAMAFVNFVVEDDGAISGESTDAAGNVLGTTPGVGCDFVGTFSDGGGGALWKPLSERTGTVVILMPAEYRNASFELVNARGDVVDSALIRDCCEHNGGREHIYLTRNAGDLAGAGTPLTARFEFSDGFTDCREVPDPTQRYD